MKKENVLFVSCYPHVMGGSQKQALHLIKGLKKVEKICPLFLTTNNGVVGRYFEEIGVQSFVITTAKPLDIYGKKIINYSIFKKASLIFPYLRTTIKLIRFVKSKDIRIVHCLDERSVLLLSITKYFTKVKILNHLQTQNSIGNLRRVVEFFSDIIVANGKFILKEVSQKALKKTSVIYSSFYPTLTGEIKKIGWLDSLKKKDICILGIFASIVPGKGYHHLVEIIQNIETDKEFVIICLGKEVEEYYWYYKLIMQSMQFNKIENITFVGWTDIPLTFMHYCDIIIFPSINQETLSVNGRKHLISGNEGLPTVILEASKLGKPVVANKVGSVEEQILDGITGFIVKEDFSLFGKKISILINDIDKRDKMGKLSKSYYNDNFVYEKYLNGFMDVYKSLRC